MKNNVWGRGVEDSIWSKLPISALFSVIAITIGLLMGGMLGRLGPYAIGAVIGIIIMALITVLRQDALAATLVVVAHIYIDWYLGLLMVAQVITFLLLVVFFLARSSQHGWAKPRGLWMWVLFLALAVFPAIQGALRLYDLAFYYPNIIGGALLSFWLGTVIAEDVANVRRFIKLLAGVGTFLAILTIVQAETGTLWFGSSRFDAEIARTADFALVLGSNISRAGSFFVNPDWNGTFFATMLFLPLGLFLESSSVLGKVVYLVEVFLILPALLFTYSAGAWLAVLAGMAIIVLLAGRTRYRVLLSGLLGMVALIGMLFFRSQINLQLQHAAAPNELSLRAGAWQTGINVMHAFPLTGIGLSLTGYMQRVQPYRALAQYIPLSHPHNSYIELGAMAGLPILAVFIALLFFALWQAVRNWVLADKDIRPLLCGGIAAIVALSFNSFSINGWTLPPLAAIGWIILGVISSPLLAKSLASERQKVKNINEQNVALM